jgi:hypothetical protein
MAALQVLSAEMNEDVVPLDELCTDPPILHDGDGTKDRSNSSAEAGPNPRKTHLPTRSIGRVVRQW